MGGENENDRFKVRDPDLACGVIMLVGLAAGMVICGALVGLIHVLAQISGIVS